MSAASDWTDGLRDAIREFGRTRRTTPLVKVRLATGDEMYVESIRPGPGDFHLTIAPYPPNRLEGMYRDDEGDYHTSSVVIASINQLAKVEILRDEPQAQTIGFHLPADDAS